jgi:hypothetical protein
MGALFARRAHSGKVKQPPTPTNREAPSFEAPSFEAPSFTAAIPFQFA